MCNFFIKDSKEGDTYIEMSNMTDYQVLNNNDLQNIQVKEIIYQFYIQKSIHNMNHCFLHS